MTLYIIKRFLGMLLVLLCAFSLTFVLFRSMEGGPFELEKASGTEQEIREKTARQEQEYKLDGSLAWQLARYLGDIAQGDFRNSLKSKNFTVAEIIGGALPVSFLLGGTAFLLAATGGILAGAYAAARKNKLGDRLTMSAALVFISTPTFVTGPLLVLLFGLTLGWAPVGGWFGWRHLILPAICLALPFGAYVSRLMRNSMVEVLQKDFVRTARAKGLGEKTVVLKHAMKVAILPVVTYLGPMAAYLLTGSMVVETVFAIPGMGQHFVSSVTNRDGFLICGAVLVYCALVVLFNLLVDIAYCLLDRRVKLNG